MAEIDVTVDGRPVVRVPVEDVRRLIEQLRFGPDAEMPRSRETAKRLEEAVAIAERGERAVIGLRGPHKEDVFHALDRMFEEPHGLSDALHTLRHECVAS